MGQRVSKSTSITLNGTTHNRQHTNANTTTTTTAANNVNTNNFANQISSNVDATGTEQSNRIAQTPALVGPTINLQIQESPNNARRSNSQLSRSSSSSLSSVHNSCPRQIIIKIQLAKMEQGNEQQQQQAQDTCAATDCQESCTDANCNQLEATTARAQILNLTLNRTAGSSASTSASVLNNNFCSSRNSGAPSALSYNAATLLGRQNALQFSDELDQSTSETAEYYEVLEDVQAGASGNAVTTQEMLEEEEHLCVQETDADNNNCCRRKSKSSSGYTSKRRCCKCTCRDAFRRILEPSSKSNKNKERKEAHNANRHSSNSEQQQQLTLLSPRQRQQQQQQQQPQRISIQQQQPAQHHHHHHQLMHSHSHNSAAPNSLSAASSSSHPNVSANSSASSSSNNTTTNQLSIWAPNSSGGGDVIIPFNSPQFVVVQCPPTSLVTLGRIDDNAIRLMATEFVSGASGSGGSGEANVSGATSTALLKAAPANGPIVHSQVDFVHCLVPDLERITNSSFYWGKMDRYEAERLLEGKPEGTFLLRDSAQEEFLFSVTFRKYGRSLHARIEQSGHKFSFDCHDPCVFTAPTVTGLLEHYKDPACVMFFEPMLTVPLHRKNTYSLQQLCRATIVSNTTYDGVNELELPARLKSYLKEYHYKQKLRVKPFDEPFYSCT